MQVNIKYKNGIVTIISYLYILLFVYAAVSKLLDFENFRVQIGQSPLLSVFAGILAWFIPLFELIIAVLITIPHTRLFGLYTAYTLMIMFTVYIYIVLNFSSFIPCSCGGVLEEMDWSTHLIFNVIFIVLALIALFTVISLQQQTNKLRRTIITMALLALISSSTIVVLFFASEEVLHRRNNFVRRFPPVPITKQAEVELNFNSYYFAGQHQGTIYLGNSTAPSHVLVFDSTLVHRKSQRINLTSDLSFNAVSVQVVGTNFYVIDGNAPAIFRGRTDNYDAQPLYTAPKFVSAEVLQSDTIALRILNLKNEYELGIISPANRNFQAKPTLIQKQIDGLFDSDGMMLYNDNLRLFIYLYYYRNQFIVANQNLDLLYKGKTIDTISKAQINVTYVKERNEKKLSAPPLRVNRTAATRGNLLFVNSSLPGQYEPLDMWSKARIIDVYNIATKEYVQSFYVPDEKLGKMSSFIVTDTHLFALVGTKLVLYKLNKKLRSEVTIYTGQYQGRD